MFKNSDAVLRRITSAGTFLSLLLYLLPVTMLLMLPTGKLDANEEQYFQLAHRFVAPEAFSPHSAAFDRSWARAASFYIIGTVVAAFGYEGAVIVLRLLNALLYAVGLASLFSALRLSAVDATLALAVFWLAGEGLFGGEWLFLGVEPKTLAYPLVLLGFGLVLRGRWRWAIPSFVGSTYLHFLVGGFWSAAALFYQWLATRHVKTSALTALTYLALNVPLLVVILFDQLGGSAAATAGLSSDYIYSTRSAHHVLPFASKGMLLSWSTPILASLGLIAALTMLLRRSPRGSRPLLQFVLCLLGYLLVALAASALDRKTMMLGKFFLFRPASVTLLLVIVASLRSVNEWRVEAVEFVKRAAAVVVIPVFLWSAVKLKADEIYRPTAPWREVQELKNYIHARSRPDQIVLIEPVRKLGGLTVALPRLLERPTLVSWKLVPSNSADIQRWYELIRYTEDLFARGCRGRLELDVAFLLVLREESLPAVQNCGEIAYRSDRFTLIQISAR